MQENQKRTTDNNWGKCLVSEHQHKDFSFIANKTLEELQAKNPNLLIFPKRLGAHNDNIEKDKIFSLEENLLEEKKLTTSNFMGFVGCNASQLSISSRFYPNSNDYFLHYMLQKVFALNIVDLKTNTENDNIWDIFLLYLFPYYLQKALNQGLYKEYVQKEYNDANVKGSIQVARHLRQNMPFMGNIAYRTREHTPDNRMTQLIRHTIEYIKTHQFGSSIINNKYDIRANCNQIITSTPTYSRLSRHNIIAQNKKTIHHPYFIEYETLRRICLQILRKEGITSGKNDNEVYGLVFDGAWLWEEYLNTFLIHEGFKHTKNNTRENPIYIFENDKYERFPDFFKEKEIVLDAKYKGLDTCSTIDRDDMHQIITYIHILQVPKGGFVFPSNLETKPIEIGKLKGHRGFINKYPFYVPQNLNDWKTFKEEMKKQEDHLCKQI